MTAAKMPWPHLTAALLPALLTGCFPYKYVVAPEVRGIVIDSRTSAPIHGAIATVSSGMSGIYTRSDGTITGTDGKFHIPRQTTWGVYVIPQAMTPIEADLHVTAPGYRPYQLKRIGAPQSLPVRGTNSVGLQYGTDSVTLQVPLQKAPR